MELPKQALEKSVLVVAHPDDEVLWFGSILDWVDQIIICFVDAEHAPELGDARRASLAEHEYRDKITLLDLSQSKSHNMSAWPNPEETDYGLRLSKDSRLDELHKGQASRVADALRPYLQNSVNIFTHNPWGEYGHEDHVQLNRVVTRLAKDRGATVWYDSYVSNKSSLLMRSYMAGFETPYYSLRVDTERARRVADTYFRNNAWTWMDDYVWFPSESFVKGPLGARHLPCVGALFPLNYLRVPFDPVASNAPRPGLLRRIYRKLDRLLGQRQAKGSDATAA